MCWLISLIFKDRKKKIEKEKLSLNTETRIVTLIFPISHKSVKFSIEEGLVR